MTDTGAFKNDGDGSLVTQHLGGNSSIWGYVRWGKAR